MCLDEQQIKGGLYVHPRFHQQMMYHPSGYMMYKKNDENRRAIQLSAATLDEILIVWYRNCNVCVCGVTLTVLSFSQIKNVSIMYRYYICVSLGHTLQKNKAAFKNIKHL